jgi:cell shape-determining protein MreC
MLIRISLILAIIAGIAVGVINFTKIKNNITDLRTHLKEQTDRADKAESDLARTRTELKKTQTELADTQKQLDSTKKDLAAANSKVNDLSKQVATLTDNLNKANADLEDAKIALEKYKSAFPTPETALSAAKDLKAAQDREAVVEDEKRILQRELVRVKNKLAVYEDPNKPIPLPASLIGKVLVADPKWDFVVLNVGADQGAMERGQLLVNRDGKLVAKVVITSVQKDRCIANVMPGWKLGDVLEGDQVIPAYPEQS